MAVQGIANGKNVVTRISFQQAPSDQHLNLRSRNSTRPLCVTVLGLMFEREAYAAHSARHTGRDAHRVSKVLCGLKRLFPLRTLGP
jgi:hypothetical protein